MLTLSFLYFFAVGEFPIRNAWANCAKYDEISETLKISSVCDKFVLTPDNRLKHLSSKACVVPESISNNSKLKLDTNCDNIDSVFQQTATLHLKHVNSGMCIYPSGGVANPTTGTELVMNENCDRVVQKILQMAEGNRYRS